MPLRGKILNTWEVEAADVLASQEVHDITTAIGVDAGSADLSGLRYHKICILADADSDGAHIATLLCALFLRHFRPLVLAGHVFVAMPPLFRDRRGQERLLRARRARQERRPRPDPGRGHPRQARHHAIQGPRRDEPAAAARDDDGARHAPARPAHAWRRRTAPTRSSTCCSRRSALPTGANGSRPRATWRPSNEGTGARLRRHREAAAPRIHGEGLPRLLDVRDPRPRAAAARGRAEAGAAADHLRDERTQPLRPAPSTRNPRARSAT